MHLYVDLHWFIVKVCATERIYVRGLEFRVINNGDSISSYRLISLFEERMALEHSYASPGLCYALIEANLNPRPAIPMQCNEIIRIYIPKASMFWYDHPQEKFRDIAIDRYSIPINVICPANAVDCPINYYENPPTPPPGMVEINPGSAVFIDQEVPLIKETWSGAHNHCQSRSAQNSDFDFTLPTYDHLKQAFDNNLIEIPPDDFEWILNRIESSPPGKFPYVTYNTVDDTAGIYPEAADSETRLTRRTSGRCVATLKS